MSRKTSLPSLPEVPRALDLGLTKLLSSMKEVVEVRLGQRGDELDSAVTLRDLFDNGVVNIVRGGRTISAPTGSGGSFSPVASPSTDEPDLTPPPSATSLTGTGGTGGPASLSTIILEWDWPAYPNHSYTEVWRSSGTSCSFDGTDGCYLIGSSNGNLYTDAVDQLYDADNSTGKKYQYWVRLVSSAGIIGNPFPNSTCTLWVEGATVDRNTCASGQTSGDPEELLDIMTGAITSSELSASLASNLTTTMYSADGTAPTTKPDGSDLVVGDLYIDGSDRFITYRYAGVDNQGNPVWVSVRDSDIAAAMAEAAGAQETADGRIDGFFDTQEPVAGAGNYPANFSYGDIWINTTGGAPLDPTTAISRWENQNGGGLVDSGTNTSCLDANSQPVACTYGWHSAPNNLVGRAYVEAYNSADVAGSKVFTFFQGQTTDGIPTGSKGDMWADTDDNYTMYVAAANGSDAITSGEWELIQDGGISNAVALAQTAQATADGHVRGFFQNTEPSNGMSFGDIWIDIDNADPLTTDEIYRYENQGGGSKVDTGVETNCVDANSQPVACALAWRPKADDAFGKLYLESYVAQQAAESASTLANGKIYTYYQSSTDPNEGIPSGEKGDLWTDTGNNNVLYRCAAATCTTIAADGWVAVRDAGIQEAIDDAGVAQATADGDIAGFFQDDEPTTGMSFGDIWVDTDYAHGCYVNDVLDTEITQANCTGPNHEWKTPELNTGAIHRYEDANGGSQEASSLDWQSKTDSAIGKLYLESYIAYQKSLAAETLADSKIFTFYQSSADANEGVPSGAVGDLWTDTADDNNTLYRCMGATCTAVEAGAWVAVRDSGIQQAIDAAGDAQSTADLNILGFFQDDEPTTGMSFGDIWIDTDANPLDTGAIHRYEDANGGSQEASSLGWAESSDNAIGQVYLNAYLAQETADTAKGLADSKIVTFYQPNTLNSVANIPVGEEGDLWVDTMDAENPEVYRCNSATGCDAITSGEWERIGVPTAAEVETTIRKHVGVCWNKGGCTIVTEGEPGIDLTITTSAACATAGGTWLEPSTNVKDWDPVNAYRNDDVCTLHNYVWEEQSTLAQHTVDVHSSSDGNSSNIQQNLLSINGLKSQYTVKIDTNGRVTGFGLASGENICTLNGAAVLDANGDVITDTGICNTATSNNGVMQQYSSFVVDVDQFAVINTADATDTPHVPFIVLSGGANGQCYLNGVLQTGVTTQAACENTPEDATPGIGGVWMAPNVSMVGINGTMVVDGSITTQKIGAGAITADQIKAGEIGADHLTANIVTSSIIQSPNFVSGGAGWQINGSTETAEFNQLVVRMGLTVLEEGGANATGIVIDSERMSVYQSGVERVRIGLLN